MTQKRLSAVRKAYVPDESLIRGASTAYRLEPLALKNALVAFGPLARMGQRKLIKSLVKVIAKYQFVAKSTRITPSKQRDRLKKIELTAQKLLRLLCMDDKKSASLREWPEHWPPRPSSPALLIDPEQDSRQGHVGRAAMNSLAAAGCLAVSHLSRNNERLVDAINNLSWLSRQAVIAAADERAPSGHGGARRGPAAKGQLIRDTINVYEDMRKRYPDSGKKPAIGGPMLTFIRMVGALVDVQISEANVREARRSRKSNQK